MDSSTRTAPIDSEILKENWVARDSVIITETGFRAYTWIHQHTQPLLIMKLSMKMESLVTHISSPRLFAELTHGFVSAHSPCWLWNSQWKLSRYPFRNHHRNCFRRWCMDSSTHAALVDLEIFMKNWVSAASEIVTETASTGDLWFRQGTQPFVDSEIVKEN
jgi:hypothetical protein